jgi:hypothetical protein
MPETLRKLQTMLQEAKERRIWGSIEISLRDGQAVLLRQMTQTKLDEEQKPQCLLPKILKATFAEAASMKR